jgi:hypothetical protein
MIERTLEAPRPPAGVGAGPFLLALACTMEQGEAWERVLAAAGVPIEARTAHTRYFRDPEGNRVAVSSYPLNVSDEYD